MVEKKNSNDNQSAVKPISSKIFEKRDALVYIGLACFIFCLFLIFSLPQACADNSKNHGFKITVKDQTVALLDANSSTPVSVADDFLTLVEVSSNGDVYTIKIYTDEGRTDYNLVEFNAKEVSVKVTESTCSESKDCVHFPTLYNSGSIYCAPHHLKIQPILDDGFIPPTTG